MRGGGGEVDTDPQLQTQLTTSLLLLTDHSVTGEKVPVERDLVERVVEMLVMVTGHREGEERAAAVETSVGGEW